MCVPPLDITTKNFGCVTVGYVVEKVMYLYTTMYLYIYLYMYLYTYIYTYLSMYLYVPILHYMSCKTT